MEDDVKLCGCGPDTCLMNGRRREPPGRCKVLAAPRPQPDDAATLVGDLLAKLREWSDEDPTDSAVIHEFERRASCAAPRPSGEPDSRENASSVPGDDGSVPWPSGEPPTVQTAIPFDLRVAEWVEQCFGAKIAGDVAERNHRFLEEALELVQTGGCTASEAHQLVDYVFGRPEGNAAQEVGGVMVTLAALCMARAVDMNAAAEEELARVWTKIDVIRAKQAAKPKHGPLPARPSGEREAPADLVALVTEWQTALELWATHPIVHASAYHDATLKLRAWRPSPPGERPACQWNEDENGAWHTGCGRTWVFTNDGPVENRMTYCMGCGHFVAAAPFIEGRRS